MSAHLQDTPVPPVSVDPRLPQVLNDVILMSVAKDADARFQTAGAFRNALSNVVPALKPAAAAAAPAPGKTPAAARPVTAVAVGQLAPQAQAARPASHRGAWMGLGAVAALLAIVAVIAIAPWKGSRAAPAKVAAPAVQPAVSEPPAAVATQPPSQPEQAAPAPAPQAVAPVPVSKPVSESPRVASRPAGAAKTVPAVSRSAGAAPFVTDAAPAAVAAPQQPVQQPVQQPAPQQQAAPTGPSRAELQQAREHIAMLGVRASGVRTSLQSLQRSQAASGMNLRGDMQEASHLMTSYLNGADAALNAGDVEQSRSFADKAERQLEKLEKFLNR